ncbi:hypothetical protein [Actinokineospora inagensis]|nr:hypothetical protein [Actinokineospora inagensis]
MPTAKNGKRLTAAEKAAAEAAKPLYKRVVRRIIGPSLLQRRD